MDPQRGPLGSLAARLCPALGDPYTHTHTHIHTHEFLPPHTALRTLYSSVHVCVCTCVCVCVCDREAHTTNLEFGTGTHPAPNGSPGLGPTPVPAVVTDMLLLLRLSREIMVRGAECVSRGTGMDAEWWSGWVPAHTHTHTHTHTRLWHGQGVVTVTHTSVLALCIGFQGNPCMCMASHLAACGVCVRDAAKHTRDKATRRESVHPDLHELCLVTNLCSGCFMCLCMCVCVCVTSPAEPAVHPHPSTQPHLPRPAPHACLSGYAAGTPLQASAPTPHQIPPPHPLSLSPHSHSSPHDPNSGLNSNSNKTDSCAA